MYYATAYPGLHILFWIIVVIVIIAIIHAFSGPHQMRREMWKNHVQKAMNGGANPSALEILKQRYAKGEINKEEFEEKKKDIM